MGRLIEIHPTTNWVSIDSTVLAAAAYVATRRWLYLKFHSGEIYRYFDFPPKQYRDFLAAESKGKYFGKHIRNHFPYEQLLNFVTLDDKSRPTSDAYGTAASRRSLVIPSTQGRGGSAKSSTNGFTRFTEYGRSVRHACRRTD